jgi:RNA polymerase sigma factor (sigma-70 family)
MTHGPLRTILRHLHRTTAGASTDAALLERFRTDRDPAAFEVIVRRHGPMVWGVCRRGVACDADADDAFQATFLVLAKRPENVRKPDALASWLHGVAGRVVQKSRGLAARRSAVERAAPSRTPASEPDAAEQGELRALLDEELARLPEKYRLPVLLCYYEGLTNEEAAKQLGWPHGTVCGRLARARTLLHTRLTRRGLALTTAGLFGWLEEPSQAATRAVMTWRAMSALRGSLDVNGMTGNVPASVRQLAEGVLEMMFWHKLKLVAATGLAFVALGGGVAGWAMWPVAAQVPAPESKAPPAAAGETRADLKGGGVDDTLSLLAKQRYEAALSEWDARFKEYQAGRGTLDLALDCARRILESGLALSDKPSDRVACYEKYVEQTTEIYKMNKARFDVGRLARQDLALTQYHTLDAEIMLLKAKKVAEPKKP